MIAGFLFLGAVFVASATGGPSPALDRLNAPSRLSSIIEARPGDVASGVIVLENERELRLKTDPCNDGEVVVFRSPFAKTPVARAECSGKVFERVQVQQQ